ncbi:MAG: D-erythronate dehydrogenase [Verrucomicrobiota bacterium]
MNVLITGGCGFIGARLAARLLELGEATPSSGEVQPIERLTVCDVIDPIPPLPINDPRLEVVQGSFSDKGVLDRVINEGQPELVFHLAAIVSGGAEEDFDLGMSINLHGMSTLLEALRSLPRTPRLVFASSVAVFGGAMPETITDGTALNPQTSYGGQKAMSEFLVNDYSRKGFIDGRALRLPTISVRGGKANKAASSFASSIIREPLEGRPYACPVPRETDVWILSPRRVVDHFIHAANLPADNWGPQRAVALPGITVSIETMVESMARLAGTGMAERIRWESDPVIEKIVSGWPTRFAPERALSMGFQPDGSIDEIIQAFIEDEKPAGVPLS